MPIPTFVSMLLEELPTDEVGNGGMDRDALLREARMVGLRDIKIPTLEAIERRRLQLWFVSMLALVGSVSVMAIAVFWPKITDNLGAGWLNPSNLRIPMLGLTF